jgi:hypothetical protein
MHIRGPRCHNPIEVIEQDSLSNVKRVAHFHLLDQVGLGAFGAV